MVKTVFIYGLNEPCAGPDPTAGRCRYIGKAADPYARYERHLKESETLREDNHKARWVRSLLKVGKTPILEILDEVPEAEWQFWETEWIRLYRALMFRLTNETLGGDGGKGHVPSEETRKKVSLSLKGNHNSLGRVPTAETRKKLSVAHTGKVFTEEHCENISLAGKGKQMSVEWRKKISDSNMGKSPSEQTRKKISVAQTEKMKSPIEREKRSLALLGKSKSPEACAKMRLAMQGNKNFFGHKHSEETLAQMSASRRLWWAKKKGLAI